MNVHEDIAAGLLKHRAHLLVYTCADTVNVGRGAANRDVYVYVAPQEPMYSLQGMIDFREHVLALLPNYSFTRGLEYRRTKDRVSFGELVGRRTDFTSMKRLNGLETPVRGGTNLGPDMQFVLHTRIYVRTVPDSNMLSRVKPDAESPFRSLRLNWHDKYRAWMSS